MMQTERTTRSAHDERTTRSAHDERTTRSPQDEPAVRLPAGETGSSLLHSLLRQAAERWPESLSVAQLDPDASRFKRRYTDAVVRFEAARVAAPERLEIGRFLVERAQAGLVFGSADDPRSEPLPLGEVLDTATPGPELRVHATSNSASERTRLSPRVPYGDREYRGLEIETLAGELLADARLSQAAADALVWVMRNGLDEAGRIDLGGSRIAILGAGAEIAPTPLLLAAGADVLWIDVNEPPAELLESGFSGRLFVPEGGSDLLARPAETAAAIRAFAEGEPVDLGLYAYAPGQGQEWRLTGAMNAIVDSLPGLVRSVGLLVSPTAPVVLTPDEVEAAESRNAGRPFWQRALESLRVVAPGYVEAGAARLLKSLVSVQGPTYQAAQYIGKILAAERWATTGPGDAGPVSVSANLAAITMTRSLRHPVFEAAFLGAGAFGVEAFEPATTRALNGLLWIHDLQNPDAPGSIDHEASPAERAAALQHQQIHGGLYSVPWEIEPAIRVAALLGLVRRPSLVGGLIGGR